MTKNKNPYKNYKHKNMTCPECQNKEILHDKHHNITFCTQCGLILNTTIL